MISIEQLWETLSPIITYTHSATYGGHCLRYNTVVGKNYLVLYTLWKTLLPIMLSFMIHQVLEVCRKLPFENWANA